MLNRPHSYFFISTVSFDYNVEKMIFEIFWTKGKRAQMFQPSAAARASVKTWLFYLNISRFRAISVTNYQNIDSNVFFSQLSYDYISYSLSLKNSIFSNNYTAFFETWTKKNSKTYGTHFYLLKNKNSAKSTINYILRWIFHENSCFWIIIH